MLASLALALAAHGAAAVASPAALVVRQDPASSTTSVTAATPSPTGAADAKLPSQAPLPPKQAWCPSEIFCAGALLQTVNIARPFGDSKTIVDKPTLKSSNETLQAYLAFGNDTNDITYGEVTQFLESYFQGEGRELEALNLPEYQDNPDFLKDIPNEVVKGFSKTVHSYWRDLIRGTNDSTLCDGTVCESTLIPLNHTFVVPGGRFREIYYWDSFFVEQGLLVSHLYDVVKSTLQNFMDQLESFGFIPNGGRIYYLNRSQPPFFIHMLYTYVNTTGDTDILDRALPLAEAELDWWKTNRSIAIKSPFTNTTRNVYHYAVTNSAPRPESYYEDYTTANGEGANLSEEQRAALYSELASGAESGWDYSSRWMKDPFASDDSGSANPRLRSLNVRGTIPVDLNSLLYRSHEDLASLYSKNKKESDASRHREAASSLRDAIIDLFWDPSKFGFYDFNSTANARGSQLTAAHFYPLAFGIHPPELVKDARSAFNAFTSLHLVLSRYNGTYPATWTTTGEQWDAPNTWPPHQYLVLEALRNLPSNVTDGAIPDGASLSLLPAGHLGVDNDSLPKQILAGGADATQDDISVNSDGSVTNGGKEKDGENWSITLQRRFSNRYFSAALCSWHATGGELPNGLLPRLSDSELNVTQATALHGNMFEKFSLVDIDSAGRGGEYTVQAGFGWTNGVLLYVADRYGDILETPACPPVLAINDGNGGGGNGGGGAASTMRASVALITFAAMMAVLMA